MQLDTERLGASCCDLCSSELEDIVNYREKLLKNQKVLEDLYSSSDTPGDERAVRTENEIVFADLLEMNESDEIRCMVMEDVEDKMFSGAVTEIINDSDSMSNEICEKKNTKAETARQAMKAFTTETNKIRKPSSRKEKKFDQPVKCLECSKEFFNKVGLTYHVWNIHQDQKQMCPTCGAILSNTKGLKSHMFIQQDRTSSVMSVQNSFIPVQR